MPAKKRWIFVKDILSGDRVRVQGSNGWETLEASGNGAAGKKGCSVLLMDDDLRVRSFSGPLDAECQLIRSGVARRAVEN